MIKDADRLVSQGWLGYMDEVIPPKAGVTQIRECKAAFVAGAIVVMEALKRIGDDDISETVGVEIMELISRDIDRLKNDIIAGRG